MAYETVFALVPAGRIDPAPLLQGPPGAVGETGPPGPVGPAGPPGESYSGESPLEVLSPDETKVGTIAVGDDGVTRVTTSSGGKLILGDPTTAASTQIEIIADATSLQGSLYLLPGPYFAHLADDDRPFASAHVTSLDMRDHTASGSSFAPNLLVNGSSGTAGQVLTSTGTSIEWAAPGGGGGGESGRFLKGANTLFYSDENLELRWDGFDEVMIRHTGAAGIPSDVYAYAYLNSGPASYPSSNPMILSSVENDFLQRSSAFYAEFSIRSDSDSTFPYYRVKIEICGSAGTTQVYWSVQRG